MNKLKITLVFLISTSLGWAQTAHTDFREDISFGLKIGANYSDVYATQPDNFNPKGKLGFATGLFASIPLTEYLGLQPELLYSEKGFTATGNVLGNTYKFTRTSSYIDIPLFLTVQPKEYFTLMIGPQYSYLLDQNNSFANATSSIETEREIDNVEAREHTFCVVGGFDINIGHFVVAPRIGIDAFRNSSNDNSTIPQYKNLWIQAMLGYRF